MSFKRKIVMVSGAPGAGKSTLAKPLAIALGFPLFSKDRIKESLTEAFGDQVGDLAQSRRIGGAAMEVMWSLASCAPCAVMEANFRPNSRYELDHWRELNAQIIEIYCLCPPEEAQRRFAHRAATEAHHKAHPLRELSSELLAEYDRPVGVGQVLIIETNTPVDADELARRITALWR